MTESEPKEIEDDDELVFLDEVGGVPYKDPTLPKEKKPIIVHKIDPVTRRFKRVQTRRIRKHDFYGDNGKLIDDDENN